MPVAPSELQALKADLFRALGHPARLAVGAVQHRVHVEIEAGGIVEDRLRDRQNVAFVERAFEGRAAMPGSRMPGSPLDPIPCNTRRPVR